MLLENNHHSQTKARDKEFNKQRATKEGNIVRRPLGSLDVDKQDANEKSET